MHQIIEALAEPPVRVAVEMCAAVFGLLLLTLATWRFMGDDFEHTTKRRLFGVLIAIAVFILCADFSLIVAT